ncbi:hypothetical protein QCA50_013959 [Cerrena zonata]|uniref:Uncharacterized protein n=1 Tax=Cerrena zonata TaxID=2478898 RepID=A0AAW0FQ84_9APHY
MPPIESSFYKEFEFTQLFPKSNGKKNTATPNPTCSNTFEEEDPNSNAKQFTNERNPSVLNTPDYNLLINSGTPLPNDAGTGDYSEENYPPSNTNASAVDERSADEFDLGTSGMLLDIVSPKISDIFP